LSTLDARSTDAHSTITDEIAADVHLALASVDDPEYAGISIVSLGMVESVAVDQRGRAVIELVPTYAGCPALELIARDVIAAASVVVGVSEVELRWPRRAGTRLHRRAAAQGRHGPLPGVR
jgi:metal-sulfur cluster biosynthetic enzyme